MKGSFEFREGDLIAHPTCPEWGPGRLLSLDRKKQVYLVEFSIAGRKRLNLSALDFDLVPWERGQEGREERHKRFMEMTGRVYQGVGPSYQKERRVTHCWFCKSELDNSIDIECRSCGWIICGCGACGCNYSQK